VVHVCVKSRDEEQQRVPVRKPSPEKDLSNRVPTPYLRLLWSNFWHWLSFFFSLGILVPRKVPHLPQVSHTLFAHHDGQRSKTSRRNQQNLIDIAAENSQLGVRNLPISHLIYGHRHLKMRQRIELIVNCHGDRCHPIPIIILIISLKNQIQRKSTCQKQVHRE